MPRKGNAPRRDAVADPKYDSTLVTRFINSIMSDGKRSIAERIILRGDGIDRGEDRAGRA